MGVQSPSTLPTVPTMECTGIQPMTVTEFGMNLRVRYWSAVRECAYISLIDFVLNG